MGGRASKLQEIPKRHPDGSYSSTDHHGYQQSPYPESESSGGVRAPEPRERKYSRIADDYTSLDQVTEALALAGLESSNLIVGIDFTKSNEWTGARSFQRKSLHHIGEEQNPYEQAIAIIGKTLSSFDEDNMIPCFGFGDASTHDQEVFSFNPDESFCNGYEEGLKRYRELAPQLRLAGPTSFAPIIEMGITIVEQSGGNHHILMIISDGQVTRSIHAERWQLSLQEKRTINAIEKASQYPLSIILVGVGDGPWEMMKEFDDNLPDRPFDNFQFVNFTEIMSKNVDRSRKETEFALSALMDIPSQYKSMAELNILGVRRGKAIGRAPLPPPRYGSSSLGFGAPKPSRSTNSGSMLASSYTSSDSPDSDKHLCVICITNPKDMAFGCGHQTCCECGQDLEQCPICWGSIKIKIKLH